MTHASVRVRFAPSPTGHLHIGGLRTALFNWLFARKYGGTFLLRIEDTDLERSKQEFTDAIFDALDWAGISSDEAVVTQSKRLPAYQAVVDRLLEEGKVYRCYCSEQDIVGRDTILSTAEYRKYDGFCRQWIGSRISDSKPYVIRFKIPDDCASVSFQDLVRGPIVFDREQFDDFIIVRADGQPMYNFVVVVDDADMRITHIIRGEDHISNTPKQILLYQACGYAIPYFAHLPLILGAAGNRLSKRDAATSVLEYRSEGYVAPALINYLVRLGWSYKDQEVFSVAELIDYFSLDQIGKKGAIFDIHKLQWLNQLYIQTMTADQIRTIIIDDVSLTDRATFANIDQQHVSKLIDIYKKRSNTLREIAEELVRIVYFSGDYHTDHLKAWMQSNIKNYLIDIDERLADIEHFDLDSVKLALHMTMQKFGLKMIELAQPLRLALIGKTDGPGVLELAVIFGKDETRKRIAALINRIEQAF